MRNWGIHGRPNPRVRLCHIKGGNDGIGPVEKLGEQLGPIQKTENCETGKVDGRVSVRSGYEGQP